MKTLIKRDILSTKNVWLFVVIIIGAVAFLNTYIDKSQEVTGGENLFMPAILMGFLGYGIVAHICRVEDLNKVNERLHQLPISVEKLILSRFISSIILIGLVITLMILFLTLAHVILNTSFQLVGAGLNAIYFTIHVILLIVSVYLPFYFAKGSNAATWAVRITFIFWLIYAVLAMPIYYHEWLGNFYSIPSAYYRVFAENLFLASFVLIMISFYSAIILYRRNRQRKPQMNHLITYMSVVLAIFVSVPFFTESRATMALEEVLSSMTLENVNIIPVMVVSSEGNEEYELDINITLSSPASHKYTDIIDETKIAIIDMGIPSIQTNKNLLWHPLRSFDELWGDGRMNYYTQSFRHSERFTEAEVSELLKEYNKEDFFVSIEHPSIPDTFVVVPYFN